MSNSTIKILGAFTKNANHSKSADPGFEPNSPDSANQVHSAPSKDYTPDDLELWLKQMMGTPGEDYTPMD